MSSASKRVIVKVCQGHACTQNFSKYTLERAEREAQKNPNLEVGTCGCQDNCKNGPTVVIEKDGQSKIHSRVNGIELMKIIGKN